MKSTMLVAVALCAAAVQTNRAAELQNAAQTSLGATATFSGAPNNGGWPAKNAIPREDPKARGVRGGVLFGAPMAGGTIHIRLLTRCHIARVDLMQLDYHFTMNVKRAEIAVDGKVVKTVDLEERPNRYQEIPLEAEGSVVSVKCLDTFPVRTDPKTGKKGANYGGWARVRVMVTDDVASLMEPPSGYRVAPVANALVPTGTAANGAVEVVGKPRVSQGHPRTTWDREDVARYRGLIKTSPEFKSLADALRKGVEKRLLAPILIPQPQKDADGNWKHVSDGSTGKAHNALSLDIANLGTAYQLFGDERYAEFAKKMLLAYADAWPNYGVGARAGFSHDPSKVFDQRLGDATWLLQIAVGYDFVRESPCFTAAERKHVEDDLVAGSGRFIRQNKSHLRGATNWSAIGTAAVLAAGVACDDEDLINTGLFGVNWTDRRAKRKGDPLPVPNRWWEGAPNEKPSGVELHFSEKSIDVDGMWTEGAMGYQFMALQALVFDAEVLWHMGIDLYRYRNCAMKCIFDSPILFAYPNLVSPAIHDSGNASIVGREAYLYEYGYRRYQDPAYLPILKRVGRRLGASFQQFTVSCLYDIDFGGKMKPLESPSVNLNGVGYGVLRVTDGEGTRNLLVDYGPNRSHGHPDKLNIDLWAFGDLQVPDPGSVWYENAIYRNWYRTTFAHNTMSVDMQEQQSCGAELLCYAPGAEAGLMRARASEAYPGVVLDRSLLLTKDYVADLFGAFSKMPRTFDLAWHPRGETVALPDGLADFAFAGGVTAGYSELREMKSVTDAASHRVEFENKGRRTALVSAAGGDRTTFVVAKAQTSLRADAPRQTPVFERRVASETVFGNVFDLTGRVKSVAQRGTALEILLSDGGRDVFAVSFAGGALETFVSRDARGGVRTLAVAGGSEVADGNAALGLKVPGGAIVERTDTGSYLVRNCSSVANEVAVKLPVGSKTFSLKAGETAEWLVNGSKPIAEHKAAVLRRLAEEAAAKEAKAKAERDARIAARRAAAAKTPGKSGTTLVVEAEDFVAEGNGNVTLNETKTAVHGKCFLKWDTDGQWLDWKVTVPAEGYYNVTFAYCSDSPRNRQLAVNGETVADTVEAAIPGTGGFSNGSDDWRLFTFPEADGEGALPVFFKKGENTLRAVNAGGGGVNLDYILVTSPDVVPARLTR